MDRFEPIFETLNATGTRYVVVGGLAVNLHGYQRFTKDVDVVIELLPEASERWKRCRRSGMNLDYPFGSRISGMPVFVIAGPVTRGWLYSRCITTPSE